MLCKIIKQSHKAVKPFKKAMVKLNSHKL